MVMLKQVSLRLKSIKNIQKITKTMKMVSASKFTRAERELQAARPFGYGPRKFYQTSHLVKDIFEKKKPMSKPQGGAPLLPGQDLDIPVDKMKTRRLYVAITSDRGLCGACHSGVVRRIRRTLIARGVEGEKTARVVCVGDKSRSMLRRQYAQNMVLSVKDIGRLAPQFDDAAIIYEAMVEANRGHKFDYGEIYYNKYYTAVKYELSIIPFFNQDTIEAAPNMTAFDDVDSDQLENYIEWTLASMLYYAMKESATSEQSARMSAMDSATSNAGEMIRKLTLLFNRTRQSVITRELIEIISGASALKEG